MRPLALLCAGLFVTAALAAPVPKGLKKVPAPLDGTWQVVEWHSGGNRMALTADIRWTIEGEALTVEGVSGGATAGFSADATRTVKRPAGGAANAIDYTSTSDGGARHSFRPAVFELDGDTFKICLSAAANGPRPAECKSSEGVLYVLKRVTDVKKEEKKDK